MKVALKFLCFVLITALFMPAAMAQFAPAAGMHGSTAIHKDSSAFKAWATGCTLARGYMNIALPDSGLTTVGDGNSAIDTAGKFGVVSLGDGGSATLTFANPINNGPGFDFAVFENGFYTSPLSPLAFLELAFVEVSSDGVNFVRFAATSNIQDTTQMAMVGVDCSLINNLAGKYTASYGTPFDLEELKNEAGLNVNQITHVRIIDVVGNIDSAYATRDQYNHKINDPYPTQFASGGFDLDAVGVINTTATTSVASLSTSKDIVVYPNPSTGGQLYVKVADEIIGSPYKLYDQQGRVLNAGQIETSNSLISIQQYAAGMYFFAINSSVIKIVVE